MPTVAAPTIRFTEHHDQYRFQSHYVIANSAYALSILLLFIPLLASLVRTANVCSAFDIFFFFFCFAVWFLASIYLPEVTNVIRICLVEIVYFEEMTMSRSRTFAAILIVVQGYDVLSLSSSQSILLINTREKEIYNRKQKNCNFVDSLTRSPTTFTVSHPKFIEIVAKEDSVKKGTYFINENKNNQRIASTKWQSRLTFADRSNAKQYATDWFKWTRATDYMCQVPTHRTKLRFLFISNWSDFIFYYYFIHFASRETEDVEILFWVEKIKIKNKIKWILWIDQLQEKWWIHILYGV